MTRQLDVKPRHREQIERLLREHLPGIEGWAYGSRVNGRSHEGSDLDLVLRAPGLAKIDTTQLAEFNEAVQESTIPFLVEARDWARLPESFHREIEREHVVLVEKERYAGRKWSKISVSKVVNIVIGGTPSRNVAEYWHGDIPWATAKDVANVPSRYLDQVQEFITKEGLRSSSTKLAPKGTLVITARGTVGALAQLSRKMAFNQTCYALLPKSGLDNNYLFYALKGTRAEMQALTYGTVFETITRRTFDNWIVPLPPLPEQCAIAHILGTLDDKIELNRRMNETLEEMARALFKSWFIDFDPVHAKATLRRHAAAPITPPPGGSDWTVERARAYLDGMDPGIAALFPDSFVDSGLGEVPAGWEVGKLGDIAEHPRRGVQPNDINLETPYIALEHMPKRCIALSEWGTAASVGNNKYEFRQGEFLFGKFRPYFHKVGIAPVGGVCSTDIVVVASNANLWSSFVLFCISSDEFIAYTDQTSTGTRMPRTSWKTMGQFEICLPTESIAAPFQKVAQPMIDRIVANCHESRTLAILRNTLLPKLTSGEIRVGE